jgi:hypothetical protein
MHPKKRKMTMTNMGMRGGACLRMHDSHLTLMLTFLRADRVAKLPNRYQYKASNFCPNLVVHLKLPHAYVNHSSNDNMLKKFDPQLSLLLDAQPFIMPRIDVHGSNSHIKRRVYSFQIGNTDFLERRSRKINFLPTT